MKRLLNLEVSVINTVKDGFTLIKIKVELFSISEEEFEKTVDLKYLLPIINRSNKRRLDLECINSDILSEIIEMDKNYIDNLDNC